MKTAQQYDWNKWRDVKPQTPDQGEQFDLGSGQSYGSGDIETQTSLIHPFQPLYDFIENVAVPHLGGTQEVLMELMQSIPAEFFPEKLEGPWPEEMYESAFEAVTVLKDFLETKIQPSSAAIDKGFEDLKNRFDLKKTQEAYERWRKEKDESSGKKISQLKFDNQFRKLLSDRNDYETVAQRLLNIGVTTFKSNVQKQYIEKAAFSYNLNPLRLYNTMMALWAKWNEREFDKNLKGNARGIFNIFTETWPTPDELYSLCNRYKVEPQTVISMFTSLMKMDETKFITMTQMVDHYLDSMEVNRLFDWIGLLFGISPQDAASIYKTKKAQEQFG